MSAREQLLREGVCLCLPVIGGNKIAITPRKISAQDIMKLSICAAYAMQNRGIRSCNVEERRGCSEGNGCRLISETARLSLSDEDVANQVEKTIKSPIG